MKTYSIKALDSDGNIEPRTYNFELQESESVLSLKVLLEERFIYTKDQLRLFFRRQNGSDIGEQYESRNLISTPF